ncbi:MAG: GNAT family N-acetyltransferase [Pirellulaceae bacterium]
MGKTLKCLWLLVVIVFHVGGCQSDELPSVVDDTCIPSGLTCEHFLLRPLEVADAEADFEAVLESKSELRALFGSDWPEDGFTLDQNRAELAEHQRAFRENESFTYAVVANDRQRILGSVYILPAEDGDANVYYWIRTSEHGSGIAQELQLALKDWLASDWWFGRVTFHGTK